MNQDLDFWEQVQNYKEHIISVFETSNELTEMLFRIKDKEIKEVVDFGCGEGRSFPYLDKFKKIHAVDFSENMLNKAKQKNNKLANVEYYKGDLRYYFLYPVDVVLSVSSVMPKSIQEFNIIISNFIKNLKKEGEIILVLPSFESRTMLFHYKLDMMTFEKFANDKIRELIGEEIIKCNYSPYGYFMTDIGLIQKHWIKDEIFYRLQNFKFKKIIIEKLLLDWKSQVIGLPHLSTHPSLWFWLVNIKL